MEVLLPLLLTLPPGAASMIGVALGLAVVFVALFFLVASFFQSPELTAMAREELAALIFTVFILMFWLGSDTILNDISSGIVLSSLPPDIQSIFQSAPCASTSGECVQGLAGSHIQLALAGITIMEDKLVEQYKQLYLFEALIGFLSTISFPIASPFPAIAIISFSLAPFTGLTLLSNAHTVIVESIGYLITVMWAKEFILLFARDAIPLLLFPLGLVLRAIPFYRKTGSSIIAVSFAVYFVFPFAIILSNYLIFDVYKPADFTYMPVSASFFGDTSQKDVQAKITSASGEGDQIREQFQSPDLVDQGLSNSKACGGNVGEHLLCSFSNLLGGVKDAVVSFGSTVLNIWRFMMGMSGDFAYTLLANPVMPSSASAGLYYFLIKEVVAVAPFIILVMITIVFEIIFTITMYRNISLIIGGEAELVGVTKII
jgi:hypothetical protein